VADAVRSKIYVQLIFIKITLFKKSDPKGLTSSFKIIAEMKYYFLLSLIFTGFNIFCQHEVMPLDQLLKNADSTPLICGHRGGYYLTFPENSISTLKHITDKNGNHPIMFEIDIRADREGELWLMHDETLDRTTNGIGNISSKSTNEIKSLKLKDQKGQLTNEFIPNFDAILSFIKDKPIYLMLDVKADIYKEVIGKINAAQLVDRCLFLTFKAENTQKVLSTGIESFVSVVVNTEEDSKSLQHLNASHHKIAAYVTDLTPKTLINELKKQGFVVLSDTREVWNKIYTPMPSADYTSFVNNKQLDILVTDFPNEVNEFYLKSKHQAQTIHNLHLKKFKWMADQQIDSLSTLLHDEVHYIHSNGWLESKSEVLTNIQSGKLSYTDVKVHQSDVRLIDNTAIVTGKGTFYVKMDGNPYEFNLYYSEVYVITQDGNKLLSRHACKY